MRLGIVILSYGSGGLHRELVESLLVEGVDPEDVLVVHNPDGTAAGSRPQPVDGVRTLVMGRNVGYGAAMNAGIAHWRVQGADWVLLLTHDVRPEPDAIARLRRAAESASGYGALGPTLVSRDGQPFSYGGVHEEVNITTHLSRPQAPDDSGIAPCDFVDGTAMLLRMRTIDEVGPLDAGFFMYFEEPDFCGRASRAGWNVGVVLDARMSTAPGRSRRPVAYGYLFARNGFRHLARTGGRRAALKAVRGQLRMTRYLVSLPYHRRFWDPEFRHDGYRHAFGLWLGILGAALGHTGPPPRAIRRMSDIAGVEPPAVGPPTDPAQVALARDAVPLAQGLQPLRVTMFPKLLSTDPYCELLDGALERRGIEVRRGHDLNLQWVRQAIGSVDVVHLHWIEFMFWPGGSGRARRSASMWLQGARFALALSALRGSGVRVVWTVHHLLPRGTAYPRLHRVLQRVVMGASDAVIAHSAYAAERIEQVLHPDAPVHVVPHGGYGGVYPPSTENRAQTRARLGLPQESFVYLLFGNVREYKRIPEAIQAFRQLPDADARLLVAGAADDLREAVVAAVGDDPRVHLDLRPIPDEEVSSILGAADTMVLNYADVFSSGMLLLAVAFGIPIVAPEAGGAEELAPPPATIPFHEGGLSGALARARQDPQASRDAAAAAGRTPDWDLSAQLLERIYRGENSWEDLAALRRGLDRDEEITSHRHGAEHVMGETR